MHIYVGPCLIVCTHCNLETQSCPTGPNGRGPNGLDRNGTPWALVCRALVGRALMGIPGPWAGPNGSALLGPPGHP